MATATTVAIDGVRFIVGIASVGGWIACGFAERGRVDSLCDDSVASDEHSVKASVDMMSFGSERAEGA